MHEWLYFFLDELSVIENHRNVKKIKLENPKASNWLIIKLVEMEQFVFFTFGI